MQRALIVVLGVLVGVLTYELAFTNDLWCESYTYFALAIWLAAPLSLVLALVWLAAKASSQVEQILAIGVASLVAMAYVPAALFMMIGSGMAQASC